MMTRALSRWPLRRWLTAAVVALLVMAVIAIPTAMVETPFFSREIPSPWWAWPSLAVSGVLAGLLAATYVAAPAGMADEARARRGGWAGGFLTFFAVGCPVCNKLVLVALGSAGAITWFEPIQPILQLVAVALLLWALRQRLLGEIACAVRTQEGTHVRHP
ncbi:hypothetical protein AFL01nite_13640 [Aeromicrobium flavum]|uniref:Uncharacterized protein n=1 Tax=Aeromicrobium flavum TaxID=416568 RepID=A0A512HUB4_9ACTN|nr:hypothetical protein [Aeromicrobium flavum]GEO89037.1 hypothetical protein AFL01nite_13640 [Aeromicrobium flavum]